MFGVNTPWFSKPEMIGNNRMRYLKHEYKLFKGLVTTDRVVEVGFSGVYVYLTGEKISDAAEELFITRFFCRSLMHKIGADR